MGYGVRYTVSYRGMLDDDKTRVEGSIKFKADKPIRTGLQCLIVENNIKRTIEKNNDVKVKNLYITNLQMLSSGRKIRRR